MFGWIRQVVAITAVSLRTVPRRLGSSIVAVVGVAGVVIVLVAVLSIGEGFRAALEGAGSTSRALVLRNGADSEMTSGILGSDADVVKQAPGIRHEGTQSLAASELFVIIDVAKRTTGTTANVPVRGVDPMSFKIRPELQIVAGRMLQFGTNEAVVGRSAAGQFRSLEVGSDVKSGQLTLTVVGIFSQGGGVAESEIWADGVILQGAYRRGHTFQVVNAQLDSAQSFDGFKDWLTTNPQLNVQVRREKDYYASQSVAMSTLINTLGYGVAALMALGAVFGAVLTMYTAVATRTREIATLRALGFNSVAVVISVLAESIVLGVIGGLIGGMGAYIGFNGYQTSTMNFQTFSQVAFSFRVTLGLLIWGLVWALAMGFIGGLFPAIRAARLPISSALREL